MKVLITGGAGYVGSTVASACLDGGIEPIIVDNLTTGEAGFVAGRTFYRGDMADADLLDRVFRDHPDLHAALHCAALMSVPESMADPLRYWASNVAATIAFVSHLQRHGCHRLLFSSTAAIYAPQADLRVDEDSPIAPGSPYGRTKAAVEAMLADVAARGPLRVLSLRYFNPIGADPQLRTGLPAHLSSLLLGRLVTAASAEQEFEVTGTGWPTRDGTGIRDFVHVWDLAQAHVTALRRFDRVVPAGHLAINLGSGHGTTVREMVTAFEQVSGVPLRQRDTGPRPGDVAGVFSSGDRAHRLLDWQPQRHLTEGIRDALRWQQHQGRAAGLLAH